MADRTEVRRALEAILMVAESPAPAQLLAQLLEVPVADISAACEELAAEYEGAGRGFALVSIAGGWRFQSHADLAPYVERFVLEGQSARLSGAALETMAIVAYKQPVSRAQVAAIRGVNVDGVMRTLQVRGFIEEVGKDPGPGQAVLFGTTPLFLERLGIDGLHELPALAAFVPGGDLVEQLEAGLRPEPGPSLSERLDELEGGAPRTLPSLDDED
jgi:segregation and condensation protein B